jgi:hypothetical protein
MAVIFKLKPEQTWTKETLLQMENGDPIPVSEQLIAIAEYIHLQTCFRVHARTTGYDDAECKWFYQSWRNPPPYINAVKPRHLRKAKALLDLLKSEKKCLQAVDALMTGDR